MDSKEIINDPAPETDVTGKLEINKSPLRSAKFKLLAAAVAITLVAAGILAWKWKNSSNGPTYQTEAVQQGSLTVKVSATGTLQPTNKVDVSSELSGILSSVEVDYNDQVKKGQVLARLDTLKLEAQMTQSKAALESAKAKLLQTRATVTETLSKLKQFQTVQALTGKKVPSQSEMDAAEAAHERAKAELASAQAAVVQAEATVEANRTDLGKAVIRSPINGVVISRSAEPGQTVATSLQATTLFTIAEDLKKMQLQVDVDEADVGKVSAGQDASFKVDAYPDRSFRARITQVRYGSKTVEGVVTYQTVLNVDNSDLLLRPGMTATAEIIVKHVENAVLVPSAALRFTPAVKEEKKSPSSLVGALLPRPPSQKRSDEKNDSKKQRVVWELKDGSLLPVTVETGAANATMTEIISGNIKPGALVVVDSSGEKK